MSSATTRPAALRLTDADRERLLLHGGTVRAAVLKLLDVADEHATCGPPRQTRARTVTPPTKPLVRQELKTYEVVVAGEVVYRTTKHAFAESRARMERRRRPADPVEVR